MINPKKQKNGKIANFENWRVKACWMCQFLTRKTNFSEALLKVGQSKICE